MLSHVKMKDADFKHTYKTFPPNKLLQQRHPRLKETVREREGEREREKLREKERDGQRK